MTTDTQEERLIEAGLKLFHEQGYGAIGVREVAEAAGVPKGSFTNHFRSKERFGKLVLDRYFERLKTVMASTLQRGDLPPRERLDAYFDRIEEGLAGGEWRRGCLVADLSAEVPSQSEVIRLRLGEILTQQAACFADVLRETAAAGGQSGSEAEIEDRAGVLIAAWHGTLLRMKVERDPEPVRRFRRVLPRLI